MTLKTENLSPGIIRFVNKKKFDDTCFTAEIVDMAAKGFITISVNSPEFTFVKTDKIASEKSLSSSQLIIYNHIFQNREEFTICRKNREKLYTIIFDLEKSMKDSLCFYHKLVKWKSLVVATLILSAAGLFFTDFKEPAFFPGIAALFFIPFRRAVLTEKGLEIVKFADTLRTKLTGITSSSPDFSESLSMIIALDISSPDTSGFLPDWLFFSEFHGEDSLANNMEKDKEEKAAYKNLPEYLKKNIGENLLFARFDRSRFAR